MELEILLKHLLPEELSEYFDLVEVKETEEEDFEEEVLSLYLNEKKVSPTELKSQQVVSLR